MKKNTTHIEQLYQELLSQDPSLVSQKSEILWLLERMTEHTPSVSIDPLFQNNLKSRLEHHIHYIQNLKTNPPEVNPRINRLARLISYGLPAVALGVIIFLALPYNPTIDQNNTLLHTGTVEDSSQTPTETTIEQTYQSQDKQIIPRTIAPLWWESKNKSLPQLAPIENIAEPNEWMPMMMKTSTPIVWWDTNTISPTTLQDSQLLQPTTIIQQYTNDNLHLSYTIDVSWEDLLLEGTLESCNHTYILSEPLVWVSNNSTIVAQIKDTSSDNTSRISVYFTDGLITKVEGLDTCK